jgi:hypothetical protein
MLGDTFILFPVFLLYFAVFQKLFCSFGSEHVDVLDEYLLALMSGLCVSLEVYARGEFGVRLCGVNTLADNTCSLDSNTAKEGWLSLSVGTRNVLHCESGKDVETGGIVVDVEFRRDIGLDDLVGAARCCCGEYGILQYFRVFRFQEQVQRCVVLRDGLRVLAGWETTPGQIRYLGFTIANCTLTELVPRHRNVCALVRLGRNAAELDR